jgi:hypothetical protein
MHTLARSKRALLLALVACTSIIAPSCSGGGDTESPSEQQYLHGAFGFGPEHNAQLAGVQVRAVDSRGTVVATAIAGGSGDFALGAATWDGFVGRIEADLAWPAGGAAALQLHAARDIDMAGGEPVHHWVGPISTLASRHRELHPELGIEAAHAAARAHLGIPEASEPGFETHTAFAETHRAPAAWSSVLAAAGSMTLDQFFDELAVEMDQGGTPRSFRLPHPYPNLRRLLYQDAGSAATTTGSGQLVAKAPFFSWESEAARLVGDYRIMAADQVFGFAVEKAGLGGTSTVELAEAIGEIQNELQTLDLTLEQNTVSQAWGYTAGLIANPAVETIRNLNNLYLQYMAAVPQNPAAAALLLQSNHQDLVYAVQALREMLAGGPNAPFGPIGLIYARSKSLERFGTETSQEEDAYWLSMQFRDNQFLDEARVATDYFCGWMVLGANLLVEWSHLNPSTFPLQLAGNENTLPAKVALVRGIVFGDSTQPGINATLQQAKQMIPPSTIGSENVIVDCGWNHVGDGGGDNRYQLGDIGTMYYKRVQYRQLGQYGVSTSLADGAFPQYSWRAATQVEYQRLRARAGAIRPDSPKEGLRAMGFDVTLGSGDLQFGFLHDISLIYSLGGDGWHYYNFDQDKDDGGVPTQVTTSYVNVILVRNTPGDRGYPSSSSPNHIADEDAGTALAVGRVYGMPLDAQGNAETRIARSNRTKQARSATFQNGALYPASAAGFVQDLGLVTPFNPAEPPFHAQELLSWLSSDTTTVLATNLPGTTDDIGSRVVWRKSTLGAGGYTLTGTRIQGLTSSAGKLGCMPGGTGGVTDPIPVDATFDPTILNTIAVVPDGASYDSVDLAQSALVYCYATGYFVSQSTQASADPVPSSMIDMTNSSATVGTVQWSASSPSGLAYFNPGSNVLHLDAAQGVETVTITVTITPPAGAPMQATGTIQVQFD